MTSGVTSLWGDPCGAELQPCLVGSQVDPVSGDLLKDDALLKNDGSRSLGGRISAICSLGIADRRTYCSESQPRQAPTLPSIDGDALQRSHHLVDARLDVLAMNDLNEQDAVLVAHQDLVRHPLPLRLLRARSLALFQPFRRAGFYMHDGVAGLTATPPGAAGAGVQP